MVLYQESDKNQAYITVHAMERATQRLGEASHAGAKRLLQDLFSRSIRLPRRHALDILGKRSPTRRRKGGVHYRVAGTAILVCRGRTVITTWRLSDRQVGIIFWWALTGIWTCDGGAR